MAIAKGIGGGFPMGACLATEEAASAMTAGVHGTTFGGNPLAMAVGNAVLDVVLEEGFLDEVSRKALLIKQGLGRRRRRIPRRDRRHPWLRPDARSQMHHAQHQGEHGAA
jgi:acetylornithine/succinyldiaminopimelate/putrescine aminotransferase